MICGKSFVKSRWLNILTIAQHQENPAPTHGARGHSNGVELDHDEPPHGQHQGVPDGHRVKDHGEVHMEQQKEPPVVGKLKEKILS